MKGIIPLTKVEDFDVSSYRFSASSIKEYLQCGLKFRYGRIDRLERTEVASHHRWFGDLSHNLIYTAYATPSEFKKWEMRDKPISLKEVVSVFEQVWEGKKPKEEFAAKVFAEIQEKPVGKFMAGGSAAMKRAETQEELEALWKPMGKQMITNGVEYLEPLNIVEIERRLDFKFLNHDFVGYVDIISEGPDGKLEFHDFKTSWNKASQRSIDRDVQFFLYSWALKDILGLDYFPVGNLVHLRSGDNVRFIMNNEIRDHMVTIIESALTGLYNKMFFDDKEGFLCSYCDFRHICFGEDS